MEGWLVLVVESGGMGGMSLSSPPQLQLLSSLPQDGIRSCTFPSAARQLMYTRCEDLVFQSHLDWATGSLEQKTWLKEHATEAVLTNVRISRGDGKTFGWDFCWWKYLRALDAFLWLGPPEYYEAVFGGEVSTTRPTPQSPSPTPEPSNDVVSVSGSPSPVVISESSPNSEPIVNVEDKGSSSLPVAAAAPFKISATSSPAFHEALELYIHGFISRLVSSQGFVAYWLISGLRFSDTVRTTFDPGGSYYH